MNNKGFVKLPRDVINKPWYNRNGTLKVYIELLINAAWKDFEYNGITLKKGQFITSVNKLAERCQLTVQQTRTALSHLRSTNDITIETTPKYSIITVLNGSEDDEDNKPANNLVNDQTNTLPNNRNRKEESEVKKEIKEEREEAAAPLSPPSFNSFNSSNSPITRDELVRKYGIENVLLYESKLSAWKSKKGITEGFDDMKTLAKWLAADNVQVPTESSFVMDEVMRRIKAQYKS